MAHQKLGNGQNTEIETDIAVVAPKNIGKGIKWNPETKEYDVAIKANEPIKINGDGELEIVISPDKYNDIEKRKNGLYLGSAPPADTSNLYVSSSQGNDSNAGTKEAPLRTINEAFKRNRPGQHFRINLYENDRHEWRTSWGAKDGYTYNVRPYGSVYDRVFADNVVNSLQWVRSQELTRPTIEFVFDEQKFNDAVVWVQRQFTDKAVEFNGIKFTARMEVEGSSIYYGVFGDSAESVNIVFRGCEFNLSVPTHYLHIGKPSSPVIFDHSRFDGTGHLGFIEPNGSIALGIRGFWGNGVRGAQITGNNSQGNPTSLTYNGCNTTEEYLEKFKGNTTRQRAGIIY